MVSEVLEFLNNSGQKKNAFKFKITNVERAVQREEKKKSPANREDLGKSQSQGLAAVR